MSTSPRLFLLLGFTLIILAVIVFPTKILLQPQPIDGDYLGVGWLFSPIIGAWGLFSVAFGLIQLSWKKLKIQALLLSIFSMALVSLITTIFLLIVPGSGVLLEMAHGQIFWFFYVNLTVIPSLLAVALTVVYLRRKEEKGPVLVSKRVRVAAFATSVAVPLLYSVLNYYMLTMHRPV